MVFFGSRSAHTFPTTATHLATMLPIVSAQSAAIARSAVGASKIAPQMMTKAHTALDEMASDGEFKRTAAAFLGGQVAPGTKYEPAAGRYHLYVSLACPWAAGTLTALHVKGLDHVISHSICHPTWRRTRPDDPDDKHYGWHFKSPGDAPVSNELGHGENECDEACVPDSVNGFGTMRQVYELAKDTSGKYSTPVLFDKETSTIVSNESLDILRIFDSSFQALLARTLEPYPYRTPTPNPSQARASGLDLAPPHLPLQDLAKNPKIDLFPGGETAAELEALNKEVVYEGVNNAVYKCGFATKQKAYDDSFKQLFASLAILEERLATKRFLGDTAQPTWLDIRLFHTLVRFDPVYVVYFKTNAKFIADFPNLLGFMRDVYQWSEVRR